MKCLLPIILAFAITLISGAEVGRSRAKRFAGFGAISTVGGRVGCVVSENGPGNYSLYINSHFTKFLNNAEQEELDEYKKELSQFKEEVKAFLKERQNQNPRESFNRFSQAQEPKSTSLVPSGGNGGANRQPEPPKKPSFCSEKAVTQYVFDGCSVQGDNVFIGDNLVRKLTPTEQQELAQFDKQFSAYQKAVTKNFRQQVEEIFGKHLGGLFHTSSSTDEGDRASPRPIPQQKNNADGSAVQQLEAPKTPDFCTLIV